MLHQSAEFLNSHTAPGILSRALWINTLDHSPIPIKLRAIESPSFALDFPVKFPATFLVKTSQISYCIPEARSVGPDRHQFIAPSPPIMPTPSSLSRKMGFRLIVFWYQQVVLKNTSTNLNIYLSNHEKAHQLLLHMRIIMHHSHSVAASGKSYWPLLVSTKSVLYNLNLLIDDWANEKTQFSYFFISIKVFDFIQKLAALFTFPLKK